MSGWQMYVVIAEVVALAMAGPFLAVFMFLRKKEGRG